MVTAVVVTVLFGAAVVTDDETVDVTTGLTCVTLVEATDDDGVGSTSSETVFLLPRRLRSLPLIHTSNKKNYTN